MATFPLSNSNAGISGSVRRDDARGRTLIGPRSGIRPGTALSAGRLVAALDAALDAPEGRLEPSSVTLPVVEDFDDRPVDLSQRFAGDRLLLVLYLGGWSEPCLEALRCLERERPGLATSGWAVAGLSTENVDRIAATHHAQGISFFLGHDHAARFAGSLGLAFKADAALRAELRSVGVRLSDWNGGGHDLTVPATLLVEADRSVRVFPRLAGEGREDVYRALAAIRP